MKGIRTKTRPDEPFTVVRRGYSRRDVVPRKMNK